MSMGFWPLFTYICFNLKSRKLMLPALHFFIPSVLQIVKETIGVGVNEKAVLRFYQTALSFTSISIFPWWTKSRPFRHFYGNSIFALFYKFIISRVLLTAGFCQKNYF